MVLGARPPAPLALWVIPVGEIGGVARHVLDVARVGIPGYRMVVLSPPGDLPTALRELGVAHLVAPIGPEAGVRTAVAQIRRVVSALRPRVLHSHLSWADVAASMAGVGSPAARISTEHGIAADDLVYHGTRARALGREALHAARLRRTDAVIAVSQSTADTIAAKWRPGAGTPVVVIRNGIDRPNPAPAPRPGLHVVSIARLAPEKRIDLLLEAVARARVEHPELRLTVAGDGPLAGTLAELRDRLDLASSVEFVGHRDPAPLLAEANVLAQLSVWENASYSLLDAVTHGLGVVATDVGGNAEIVSGSALVAPEADAVAAALVTQGLSLEERPRLPENWPTVADMTAAIAAVYDAARLSA